ncbi:hypothetical protein G4B88_019038 [Cannabis sativa]|uniref:Reverse transcriptase zinc-binding domain-containing protein n=1 Tax=Cannabis sativa TaxID=3483 RepID=A0A7J6H153_CANSA|nr:hypothetical protein G4B88_019038 [Cannabis sativa]
MYTIKLGYGTLVTTQPVKLWYGKVWSRFIIPKHKFILWLAVMDRLQTKSRLLKFNIFDHDSCLICEIEAKKFSFKQQVFVTVVAAIVYNVWRGC